MDNGQYRDIKIMNVCDRIENIILIDIIERGYKYYINEINWMCLYFHLGRIKIMDIMEGALLSYQVKIVEP